eukprot:scaffold25817_cov33-Tisochrysis_lutea.AAC.1
MELLISDESDSVLHGRAHVCSLVHAPIGDELLAQRLVVERVGGGEGLHLRGIQAALPERALGDIALKVMGGRIAAQICSDDGGR